MVAETCTDMEMSGTKGLHCPTPQFRTLAVVVRYRQLLEFVRPRVCQEIVGAMPCCRFMSSRFLKLVQTVRVVTSQQLRSGLGRRSAARSSSEEPRCDSVCIQGDTECDVVPAALLMEETLLMVSPRNESFIGPSVTVNVNS